MSNNKNTINIFDTQLSDNFIDGSFNHSFHKCVALRTGFEGIKYHTYNNSQITFFKKILTMVWDRLPHLYKHFNDYNDASLILTCKRRKEGYSLVMSDDEFRNKRRKERNEKKSNKLSKKLKEEDKKIERLSHIVSPVIDVRTNSEASTQTTIEVLEFGTQTHESSGRIIEIMNTSTQTIEILKDSPRNKNLNELHSYGFEHSEMVSILKAHQEIIHKKDLRIVDVFREFSGIKSFSGIVKAAELSDRINKLKDMVIQEYDDDEEQIRMIDRLTRDVLREDDFYKTLVEEINHNLDEFRMRQKKTVSEYHDTLLKLSEISGEWDSDDDSENTLNVGESKYDIDKKDLDEQVKNLTIYQIWILGCMVVSSMMWMNLMMIMIMMMDQMNLMMTKMAIIYTLITCFYGY